MGKVEAMSQTSAGGHVFPEMTVMAKGTGSTTEAGIGALIPWAEKLWLVGYVAHIKGEGLGLYEIDSKMNFRRRPESVTGTFANRMVHWPSKQVFIGPHAIDEQGRVRTIPSLTGHRLTATAPHLTDPDNKVYFLTMEGLLFECDVKTLETAQLADLNKELNLPGGAQPHYKGAWSGGGRLVIANNTYDDREYRGERRAGRLAEWDGKAWKTLEENPFIEVSGKGNTLYALGWDSSSVILRVFHGGKWSRYRLPQGSHEWEHTWFTEWMRIRQVQTERFLMDAFGIFYILPEPVYAGRVWGIKPICSHLRICPDMVCYRGMLVLAGDQTDSAVGQPQSGLWFGSMDDLWKWGKPTGWGGVWRKTGVAAGETSDPFLMTGFDKKTLHLANDSGADTAFTVEVDFVGDGDWKAYRTISVAANGYEFHVFPDGFSAHWVRIRASGACRATAWFVYN